MIIPDVFFLFAQSSVQTSVWTIEVRWLDKSDFIESQSRFACFVWACGMADVFDTPGREIRRLYLARLERGVRSLGLWYGRCI